MNTPLLQINPHFPTNNDKHSKPTGRSPLIDAVRFELQVLSATQEEIDTLLNVPGF